MIVSIPITLASAGAAAIINIWLGVRIGQVRTKAKISIGDGGNIALITRMRAQANFIEFTPIVLILIGAIELTKGSPIWLWAIAALFLLGRIGHALGMDGLPAGRMVGTLISMLTLLGLGIYAIVIPLAGSGPTASAPITTTLPNG